MQLIVLGSAAGGGVPQWNCRCPVCELARAGDGRVTARTQCGLAVSADGLDWVLLNASPDIREQLGRTRALHPQGGLRSSPIAGIILTNGEIDSVAGLLTLRESQAFRLYGAPDVLEGLGSDAVFGVLGEKVERIPFKLDEPIELAGLNITPFPVPGKLPLYLETSDKTLEAEVIGLEIAAQGRRCLFVPNCAEITPSLQARLAGADLLFFDGTLFRDDELVALGASGKTGRRMGHIPMAGPAGSLESLGDTAVQRRLYIHINNTNRVLIEDSEERRQVEDAGWEIAHDGMEIAL